MRILVFLFTLLLVTACSLDHAAEQTAGAAGGFSVDSEALVPVCDPVKSALLFVSNHYHPMRNASECKIDPYATPWGLHPNGGYVCGDPHPWGWVEFHDRKVVNFTRVLITAEWILPPNTPGQPGNWFATFYCDGCSCR